MRWILFLKNSTSEFLLIFLIIFTFTYKCVHYLSHSPLPHISRKNLFCPLILQLCWRENIRNNKKNIMFLLAGDKDSYAERFLMLLPCICMLIVILVHLYQTSSLLPNPLPILASASLRLLYLLLCSEHTNYIEVLGSLSFIYFSRLLSPLSVWTTSNITAFVLSL
jgi:hypothetical protein